MHTPLRQPRRALLPVDRQAAADVTEFTAVAGCGALAGIACCGPSFVLGLAQLLFALGGVATLVTLIRFEALISLGIALIAWLGWRIATDRLSRAANGLLAAVALLDGLGRLLWSLNDNLITGLPPAYWFFVHRQAFLGAAAVTIATVRSTQFVASAIRRVRAAHVRAHGCWAQVRSMRERHRHPQADFAAGTGTVH